MNTKKKPFKQLRTRRTRRTRRDNMTYNIYIYSRGGSRDTFGLEAQVLMLFTLGLYTRIILYCTAVYCTNVYLFFLRFPIDLPPNT